MFYDAINCWDNKVSVTEDGMSMEHLWNKTDSGKQKSLEKNLYRCYCVLHKFNMVWPGSEAAPPHWEMVAQPTDVVFHGLFTSLIYIDSDSSRYICILKLPVWKIYSFCEEMQHHMWSRVSRISDKLINSLNRFVVAIEGKILPENFILWRRLYFQIVFGCIESLVYKMLFYVSLASEFSTKPPTVSVFRTYYIWYSIQKNIKIKM